MLSLLHKNPKILLSEVLPLPLLVAPTRLQNLVLQVAAYMWCHHLSHINENGLKYLSCSESCLYQMQISLLVFIATCTMCMSSLTEDSSWCLYFVVCFFDSPASALKCTSCRLSPVSLQLTFHGFMFMWPVLYSRFKTRTRSVFTCWHLDEVML